MDSVNTRYSGIWKLLSDYNFDSNKRCYPDLICVICNKLLRNAHQNECGCRYCLECIQLYSQNNDKSCPGKTEECNEKIIDLLNDIQEDYTANKKLSMITVTCPILDCQHADYLINMEKHVQSHQVECPYIDIGCKFDKDIIQNVNAHLNQDSYAHSKLIIQSLFDLKISMFPMIEKLHKNHAEDLNEYFFNSFKMQEDKIANLQSENEQFRKQLENILNQFPITSISNNFSSAVTEDHTRFSQHPNQLNRLENVVTTIAINNNSNNNNNNCAHLDNMELLKNDISNLKTHTDSELSNHKRIHKKINDDIQSLQISHSKSKCSSKHFMSTLDKHLIDYRYDFNKMQLAKKKFDKINDEMDRFNEKFNMNIDDIISKMKRMQRDIDKIERNSSIDEIEKFNKMLKNYFIDSEELREKFSVCDNELELSKRDIEKVHIKCHSNKKELSIFKENFGNFEIKINKINNKIDKINEKFSKIEQNHLENNNSNSKSIKNSDYSKSISLENIIDLEEYNFVIDNLQMTQRNIFELKGEMNMNSESIADNVDSIDSVNNDNDNNNNNNKNSSKINEKEIMNYLEKYNFGNKNEMENNFHKINEEIITIKRILNDFQMENNSIKNIYRNINEQQLQINNRLIEIDKTLDKNSNSNDNFKDIINKTIKEISEMKNTAEKYQHDTNSTQLNNKKSIEKLFSTIENLRKELEIYLSNQNQLQIENNKINQDINRVKSEMKTNCKDVENVNFFMENCEQKFENMKKNIAIDYDKIEVLKTNNANSWENIKRINIDLEKLSKEIVLIHKFNDDSKNRDKEKISEESRRFESYINKLKEENLKIEIQNNDNLKVIQKNIDWDLKKCKEDIEEISNEMQIIAKKSDQSHESLNKAIVLGNIQIEQTNQNLSSIQSLKMNQIELGKKFDTLSKSFRNLKTECLNRISDLISERPRKKPNINREWKIENFHSQFKDAQDEQIPYLTSEWFNFQEYRVAFKLYPNGDDTVKNRYLSIFCFIHKLKDDLPHRKVKLTISLVDRLHESRNISKEYNYYNFIKQESSDTSENNELGASNFISLDNLFHNSTFIENDSILFRFVFSPLSHENVSE